MHSYILCTLGIIYSTEGRSISKMPENAHYISDSCDVTAHYYGRLICHTYIKPVHMPRSISKTPEG